MRARAALARALSVALILLPGGALALSCLPPDALRSYQRVAAAPEPYVVLLGTFRFEDPGLPAPDLSDPRPQEHVVPAQFEGQALGPEGFLPGYALDLDIELGCAGPWCAGLPASGPALAFVRLQPGGYRLELGPCGGQYFTAPEAATIKAVEACHEGSGHGGSDRGDADHVSDCPAP